MSPLDKIKSINVNKKLCFFIFLFFLAFNYDFDIITVIKPLISSD